MGGDASFRDPVNLTPLFTDDSQQPLLAIATYSSY